MKSEPQIQLTETNPGEKPMERAAAELKPDLKFRFEEKNSRAIVIERLKAARNIPILDQEYILARIAAIPEQHAILQVSIIGTPHKAGFNFTFTVCEIG